jgi:RNA polymerase sigma-70 factor (ECF subfamily)
MDKTGTITNIQGKEGDELTAVIERAIAGDVQAYEEIMKQYAGYILVFVGNMAESRDDTEDIAQEVAIEIYKSIGRLNSPYAFTSWLRQLMQNVVVTYNHRKNRFSRRETLTDEMPEQTVRDVEDLPEAATLAEDARAEMYRLIAQLKPIQRKTLYLFYYEDLTYKEIAELLGVKVMTVGSNIKKAKNNLLRLMKEDKRIDNTIKDAFAFASMGFASEAAVGHFVEFAGSVGSLGLESGLPGSGAPRKPSSERKLFYKLFGGMAAVGLAICAAVALWPNPEPTPVPSETPAAFTPSVVEPAEEYTYTAENAQIIFQGSSEYGDNVNIEYAEIIVGDAEGTVSEWVVTDESGATVSSGKGERAPIPASLADGKYTITWMVTSHGAAASIHRDFYFAE